MQVSDDQLEQWGTVAGKTIVIYLIPGIFGYFFGLTVFFCFQVIFVIAFLAITDVTSARIWWLSNLEEELEKDEERIRNEKDRLEVEKERLEVEKEILKNTTNNNQKDID
tara:strand:+ start:302 stop:631 length:330 start_codon:yes stop_codon:yes gene_type:complete